MRCRCLTEWSAKTEVRELETHNLGMHSTRDMQQGSTHDQGGPLVDVENGVYKWRNSSPTGSRASVAVFSKM